MDITTDQFKTTRMEAYSLQENIGHGSYGCVFKAIKIDTGKQVAIKVIEIDKQCKHLKTQLLMISRELYLLKKFASASYNGFTIRLLDAFVND